MPYQIEQQPSISRERLFSSVLGLQHPVAEVASGLHYSSRGLATSSTTVLPTSIVETIPSFIQTPSRHPLTGELAGPRGINDRLILKYNLFHTV